jgi:tripartite-type tricarboxylate transporter receptor subunit TctC
MRQLSPRTMLLAAAIATLATLGPVAHARDAATFTDSPVKLMVGFVPGGPTDLYARIAGRVMAEALGQQVVIENRAGGSGAIAAKAVAAAD